MLLLLNDWKTTNTASHMYVHDKLRYHACTLLVMYHFHVPLRCASMGMEVVCLPFSNVLLLILCILYEVRYVHETCLQHV